MGLPSSALLSRTVCHSVHYSPAVVDFLSGKKQTQCTGSLSLYWHSCLSWCHLAAIPVCREDESRCVYWLVLLIVAVPEQFLAGCCKALTQQFAGCSGGCGQAAGCVSLCVKPRTGKPNSVRERTNQGRRKIKNYKTTGMGFKSGCWFLSPWMTSVTIIKGMLLPTFSDWCLKNQLFTEILADSCWC